MAVTYYHPRSVAIAFALCFVSSSLLNELAASVHQLNTASWSNIMLIRPTKVRTFLDITRVLLVVPTSCCRPWVKAHALAAGHDEVDEDPPPRRHPGHSHPNRLATELMTDGECRLFQPGG